jgi:hypothetical protein
MTPLQPLVQEDLIDAAPLDRDSFLLVEIGLQAVEGPTTKRQTEGLGIGQGRGDYFRTPLGGVGLRAARAGAIVEAGQPLLVETMNPVVNSFSADMEVGRDGTGALSLCSSAENSGARDESSRCRPGLSQLLKDALLLGGQSAQGDLGDGGHGSTSTRKPILSTRDCPCRITCRMNHLV